MSQLDLSTGSGLSSRHISFLETGRANPSRGALLRLCDALAIPLRERNGMLLAAGFSPEYRETDLADASMEPVRHALSLMLRKHEPYPAFVLDRRWNIVRGNRIHNLLLQDALGDRCPDPVNVLKLMVDPELLRPAIRNWDVATRVVLRRFLADVDHAGGAADLVALKQELESFPGVRDLTDGVSRPGDHDLLIPLELESPEGTFRWFTTIATLGTPQDITLQEMRIEFLFPADEATDAFAQALETRLGRWKL